MTRTMSPATTLWVHPMRSVRRASGLVLVNYSALSNGNYSALNHRESIRFLRINLKSEAQVGSALVPC